MMLSNSFCLQANAKNLIGINTLDDLSIAKLTNELNRQSLMFGYIDAFKLYAWVGFLSIPLIFLIKVKKEENN